MKKLIIIVPDEYYEYCKAQEDPIEIEYAVKNGILLDDIKEEISNISTYKFEIYNVKARVLQILDNIGRKSE